MMECPNCGASLVQEKNFCEQCGYDLRKDQHREFLLEHDPKIAKLNESYAKTGLIRYISSIAFIVALFFMYYSLEGDLPDGFGIFGMLVSVPALAITLVALLLRRRKKKQIIEEMDQRLLDFSCEKDDATP